VWSVSVWSVSVWSVSQCGVSVLSVSVLSVSVLSVSVWSVCLSYVYLVSACLNTYQRETGQQNGAQCLFPQTGINTLSHFLHKYLPVIIHRNNYHCMIYLLYN
jgi:hypothetical protein